jgi:beta-glucosidase
MHGRTDARTGRNTGPGRTYKYLKDPSLALWPFGFGLSYTTFSIANHTTSLDFGSVVKGSFAEASVTVTNTGKVAGDEVVFLFKQSLDAVKAGESSAVGDLDSAR